MEYEMLLNKIVRSPQQKGAELLSEYQKKHEFKIFAEQQRVLDILTLKTKYLKRIKKEAIMETVFSLKIMATRKDWFGNSAFTCMKQYPMFLWIEGIGTLEPKDIISLLKNYHKELTSNLIETCIINLPDDAQISMINKYHKEINSKGSTYYNFYYSVSPDAQETLDKLFPNVIKNKLLLEIKDVKEEDLITLLKDNIDNLKNYAEDDIIEAVLLKVTCSDILEEFFKIFKDGILNCSDAKFEFLLKRYRFLPYAKNDYYDDDAKKELSDLELFECFKEKFHKLGVNRTLKIFNRVKYYGLNDFTATIISDFIDIAYAGGDLSDYLNEETLESIIQDYTNKCNEEEYTLEEFSELVKKCGKENKLIKDDFIKAITACGKLLRNNTINDKHPLFIELRDAFNKDLFDRLEKDGTITEPLDFKGIFYRLAKGTLPFEEVYLTKTYRGIIYLSKCGNLTSDADYITSFLTDEQILKLNISPMLRWKKNIVRTNTKADIKSLFERMSLQLLLFFGEKKGEYLIKANISGNRMESLFDGLNYKDIKIDEQGKPIINEELNNYLFGYGSMSTTNNVINRLIRGDIMKFEDFFTEFSNNFYDIKEKCNGVLSINRILRVLENVNLPIELKPDEKHYEKALKELNTTNEVILKEAVELLNEARKRKSSTIPKVKGELGEFTYEMLDLNDPLNIAVGYLSHCCFKVQGISYSALIQALKSRYGRIFVVYYKGSFLTQSWVWRNGDVVCFDSVEAGSPVHGAYNDDIHLLDVYKTAAEEILRESHYCEDPAQAVKLVTIGRSDFIFGKKLEKFKGEVPRPIEKDVYIYDSNVQSILAGCENEEIRYGHVGAEYVDPRIKPMSILNVDNCDIDLLDEVTLVVDALRYQILGTSEPVGVNKCHSIYCGYGWYIIKYKDNTVEKGILYDDEYTTKEYNSFLNRLNLDQVESIGYSKSLKPSFK